MPRLPCAQSYWFAFQFARTSRWASQWSHSGIPQKDNFFLSKTAGTQHIMSGGEFRSKNSWILVFSSFSEIYFPAAARRGWMWWWRQKIAACLLLGCQLRRTQKVSNQPTTNVNLWNRPIFQQLGFPIKHSWHHSRRRFCPFLVDFGMLSVPSYAWQWHILKYALVSDI